MQTYIVLDLEWNQSATGKSDSVPGLPFEIIEIGAVKLDENLSRIGDFHRVIKPSVYKKLHFRVTELVNISPEELKKDGKPFKDVCREFLDWCFSPGEEPVFCTWGEADLTQLQKNMAYHKVESPFRFPFLYYDIQKLYSIVNTGAHKFVAPLDKAIEELMIPEKSEFHRALCDADYTAKVMSSIDFDSVRELLSIDYYNLPANADEAICMHFPGYTKYVSCEYDTREQAFADKDVTVLTCPLCNNILKLRVGWFSANQKQYHAVGCCKIHGCIKGKIKVKHSQNDRTFIVKTIKPISDDKAAQVKQKMLDIRAAKAEKRRRQD